MFWNKQEAPIRFLCNPDLKGIIPEPYPAKKYIPEWYKKLELYHTPGGQDWRPTPTLKRCPPFLDALCAGWIIPLVAEIHFQVRDNATGVSWNTDTHLSMVESHSLPQISTHPKYPKVPLKFINHWLVQTAPGWSCLFVPPLNRSDDKLELMSGIVETDKYFEYVNFPGMLRLNDGYHLIQRGYPLMQVIPFKRNYNKESIIESLSSDDLKKLNDTRIRKKSEFSFYRDNLWEKKI